MKRKVLLTLLLSTLFSGAYLTAAACSGTYYTANVEQAIADFNANCSAGDVVKIIDIYTGAEIILSKDPVN